MSTHRHIGFVFILLAGLVLAISPASLVGAQTPTATDSQVKPVGSNLGIPGKLGEAIAKAPEGQQPGQIDPQAAPGYLGIPGGQQINLVVAFFWAIWVGWVFSTVGAFGGIMAGVGHISVFGLGAYAKTFKDTAPELNKFVTDSIRVSNQWLVGLSAAVSSVNYAKQKRLIIPLGLALGLGSLLAAFLVVYTTMGKIKFSQYQGYFGLIVFIIGGFMIYEMTPRGQSQKKAAKEAAKAFESHHKAKGRYHPIRCQNRPFQFDPGGDLLFRPDLYLQPDLGLCRRLFHQRHLLLYRCGRGLSLCTVPDQHRGSAHVRRGRHLGPGRVDQHDPLDFQFHDQGGHHLLGYDRGGACGYFHRVDDWPPHRKIYS